jgi:ABC-type glycerol-3-phosphate transport system substrate-binding protein
MRPPHVLVHPDPTDPWARGLGLDRHVARRDVLKLGAAIVGGAAMPSLLSACAPAGQGTPTSEGPGADGALAGTITVLHGGGDPAAEPALMKVYEDFKLANPDIEWDIRPLPGGGPEYDRLARAAVTSGEPVGLVLINGQQLRGWVRDGLLLDLGAEPALAEVLARVPTRFHFGGHGETTARALPLAVTRGVHTTGIYVNEAMLDAVGLVPPTSIAEMRAMVEPLAAIGAAPLVHPSGDVIFNQMLVTWILPMIAERSGDPIEFAESTVRGDRRYDSAEWIETFETIAALSSSGVLLKGSGAVDYPTMQQLLLQGKAAMSFNGSWLLPQLLAGTPTVDFDLHVSPPPLVEGATTPRPILAWGGFAIPTAAGPILESVIAFLEDASRPEVDRAVVEGIQSYSPIEASNVAIENEIAQEFLPLFDDAITPLDWLWEPEITAEIDTQVQALVNGGTDPMAAARAVQGVAEALRSSGRSYDG